MPPQHKCLSVARHIMRPQLIITFLLLTVSLFGQQNKQTLQFKKTDYPASKFVTKSDTSLLGQVQIIITMTHPKNSSVAKFLCRSWLTIKKNDKVLNQKYYDIEPVGGCSGLYKPTKQPCKDYFIISKFGDYQGETLLIDTTGKLTTLTGGAFSLSTDNSYLFAIYDSDISGVTIYDLKNKKLVLSKEKDDEDRYNEFYFQDGTYFVSIDSDETAKEISVGVIDIKNKKVTITKKAKTFLKKTNKLKTYNAVQSLTKCNCGQ
jgi:hypothetical protein